jgi:hypothetical protein
MDILLSLSSLSFLSSLKSFIDFFSNPPIVFPGPFPLGVPFVIGVEEGDCRQSLSVALDGANPIDRAVVTFRGVVGVGEGTAGDGTDMVWYVMYRQLMVELGYREITLILMGILCRSGGLDFASRRDIVRTGERVCGYLSSE